MMTRYNMDMRYMPWIWQEHGFYTKNQVLDTAHHDMLPVLNYPCIIGSNPT